MRWVEGLEERRLFAFPAAINFQPAGAALPAGHVADTGSAFASRPGGYQFGWDQSITFATRDRNAASSPDQRYDTFIHTQLSGSRKWELAVPNGAYTVRLVAGDASYFDSVYKFNLEGALVLSGAPTSGSRWIDKSVTVTVSDGRLTLTNAAGAINNKLAFLSIAAASSQGQTPFSGAPASISGTIEAENFDNGNAGVAYFDTTSGNAGNLYRLGNVDIVAATDAGGGYGIGYTRPGEWLEYTVNVAKTGTYTLELRVASPTANGKLHLAVDGVDKTGAIVIPNTGGWQSWKTLTKSGVTLSAGTHVLRLQFDSSTNTGDIANVNWLKLSSAPQPVTGKPGAHNTGPTNRSNLRLINGVLEIHSPGVYEDFDAAGGISIYAANVTLRNFVSRNNIKVYAGENIVMEDGEITTGGSDGISGSNMTLRRLHFFDVHDAIRIGPSGNVLIEDCFIESVGASTGGHSDGIQAAAGVGSVTIRHNTIIAGDSTSCLNNVHDWLVEGNYFSGGQYTMYMNPGASSPRVINNVFVDIHASVVRSWPSSGTWSGNVHGDTGQPIV